MKSYLWIYVSALAAIAGCGRSPVAQSDAQPVSEANRQVVAASEPSDAIGVGLARQEVESGEQVTLVGKIGGSSEPFVEGMAAFTIVDASVPHCSADEGCPRPWDYCCTQDQVKENIATVKVVDDQGSPLASDARELLGVKELSTVVVEGEAIRDEQGNLTVATKQVFVRPDNG